MALTVAGIQSDVSIDVRQVLSPTDSKIVGWVDRIHKDCLHSSLYSYLNVNTMSFSTVPGQQQYTLPVPIIRRIVGVQDITRSRILFPIERATTPVDQGERREPNPGQPGTGAAQLSYGQPLVTPISLQAGQPNYYRHFGAAGSLNLYPAPQSVLLIGVSYEAQVATLVNPTDVLIIPEDARNMVVSGVDWLANTFLKRTEEAQSWLQIYQMLKTGQNLI